MKEEPDVPGQRSPRGRGIRLPSREAVFRNLGKVAKRKRSKRPEEDDSGGREGGAQHE